MTEQPYTRIDRLTGAVVGRGSGYNPKFMENETFLIEVGTAHENGYYENGVHHPLPEPPSTHHIFDYATKQWVDPRTPETEWVQVRALRNQKLRDTDWTQIPDSPFAAQQRQQWVQYRQALRDVTNQQDPFNIVWPVAPGSQS